MIRRSAILVALAVMYVAGPSVAQEPGQFGVKKKARIVLVGNGLGSRMLHFGHFETGLHLSYPDHDLFIRNMCDEGNTPSFRPHSGRKHQLGFPGAEKFTLLIDLKSDGEKTYAALHEVLSKYAEMLTTVEDGKVKKKAITIVISGNRPLDLIARGNPRYAGMDGRLSDLDSELPAHLLPMISDRWGSHFKWRGEGDIPEEDRKKLREVVRKAHARGRSVRFWATPEKPAVWKVLHEAGVDHINTDKLAELKRFLLEQKKTLSPKR